MDAAGAGMIDVAKLVAPLLGEIGFKKRADGIFTVELVEDVIGMLALNTATEYRPGGQVQVFPGVGVRHQGVERMVAECRGKKFHPYTPPTVATLLGHVFPEPDYRVWVFRGGAPAQAVERDMVGAVEEHGLPFMRSMTRLSEIRDAIENGFGTDDQFPYRLVAALLLDGHPERARQVLDEALVGLGDRTDRAAEEFRRFAVEFRQRLDEGS